MALENHLKLNILVSGFCSVASLKSSSAIIKMLNALSLYDTGDALYLFIRIERKLCFQRAIQRAFASSSGDFHDFHGSNNCDKIINKSNGNISS